MKDKKKNGHLMGKSQKFSLSLLPTRPSAKKGEEISASQLRRLESQRGGKRWPIEEVSS